MKVAVLIGLVLVPVLAFGKGRAVELTQNTGAGGITVTDEADALEGHATASSVVNLTNISSIQQTVTVIVRNEITRVIVSPVSTDATNLPLLASGGWGDMGFGMWEQTHSWSHTPSDPPSTFQVVLGSHQSSQIVISAFCQVRLAGLVCNRAQNPLGDFYTTRISHEYTIQLAITVDEDRGAVLAAVSLRVGANYNSVKSGLNSKVQRTDQFFNFSFNGGRPF